MDAELRTSVQRLTRDLAIAAATMTADEARFLVDAYYISQENRKRTFNQDRAMEKEPHFLIEWLALQNETLEGQIKRALDKYTDAHKIGQWMKSIHGIGPVIAAGLMAHIDINKAPTAGHIWRYAGLDPTSKWKKGEKRPWNAELKTLCWKIGQSFMKFHNHPDCFYGHLYVDRKAYENARNERGGNAETAKLVLETRNIGRSTDAYKHLNAGKLPPAQIDARARRFAVKIFLSHVQWVWWWYEKGEASARPYAIVHAGHVHITEVPNAPPGLPAIGA